MRRAVSKIERNHKPNKTGNMDILKSSEFIDIKDLESKKSSVLLKKKDIVELKFNIEGTEDSVSKEDNMDNDELQKSK